MSKTKIAFRILLLHLAYGFVFAAVALSAYLLDRAGGVTGIHFTMLIIMLALSPVVGTLINGFSVFFQIWGLRRGESKVKNVLMMVITVLHEVSIWWLLLTFWEGAMSV